MTFKDIFPFRFYNSPGRWVESFPFCTEGNRAKEGQKKMTQSQGSAKGKAGFAPGTSAERALVYFADTR